MIVDFKSSDQEYNSVDKSIDKKLAAAEILIVDDDMFNLKCLHDQIRLQLKVHVCMASDGQQAIDVVK